MSSDDESYVSDASEDEKEEEESLWQILIQLADEAKERLFPFKRVVSLKIILYPSKYPLLLQNLSVFGLYHKMLCSVWKN